VRHVRMLGLCLVAALALGAYAVSSASALEWGKCELAGPGHNYTGPNCTKAEKAKPKGSGSYEWLKASQVAEKRVAEGKTANVPFSGGSVGGGGVLTSILRYCNSEEGEGPAFTSTRQGCEENGGKESQYSFDEPITIECAAESNTGEAEGKNKVANIAVVFTGCVLFGSVPCSSEGAAEGEIETNTLKGKLGWLNKSAKEVGVLLEPAQHHGTFATFVCAETGAEVAVKVGVGNKKEGAENVMGEQYPEGCYGECPGATPTEEKHGGYDGIISPITPVNTMVGPGEAEEGFTQVYTEESKPPFRNLPTSFENKHIDALEALTAINIEEVGSATTDWSAAGEAITNVNTPEEAGEIKA
jgi:hypothetical protein